METLLTFAERYNIPPSEAHILPALFEKAASEANMDLAQFIDKSIQLAELGQYLADITHKIMEELNKPLTRKRIRV